MGWYKFKRKQNPDSEPSDAAQNASEHSVDADENLQSDFRNPSAPPNTTRTAPSSEEFGNHESGTLGDIKSEVLANWLHGEQEEKLWTSGRPGEGVFVKKSKGIYAYSPPDLLTDGTSLCQVIPELNVRCAMTVSTRVIRYILARTELPYVQIRSGLRLQVIPEIDALPYCQKGQSAAFIASHQMLVVWQDDPRLLLENAEEIQNALVRRVCGDDSISLFGEEVVNLAGKTPFNDMNDYVDLFDNGESNEEQPREMKIWQAAYTGISVLLLTVALGSGWRHVAIQHLQEPKWGRFLFILVIPGSVWLSLFFFQAVVGNIAQMAGPTNAMKHNSIYYSATGPRRIHRDTYGKPLPHVTIQMPVYKEGLRGVIEPTIRSIKQAIATYELQGGTANIFINEDGMQLISEAEATERQEFYDEHGIGWVARPKHNPNPKEGERYFHRRGKFKKASNMNYGLRLSARVEEILIDVERSSEWTQMEENDAYKQALDEALAERGGETWADGSIRMGDYILLIDSDTRVPHDCLLEAVSEMEQCPRVAILQYVSGVMNVTTSFFEKGITFFTNMIYTMIRFTVAHGDVAPFVGHNAILRWSALQAVAYHCPNDNWEKFWSESTVSEDFDMALRLQAEGYIVRLAAYKNDGFQEGVSLTVYDELARWEKYAYGCNELIFHPCREWIFRGPFTKLFVTFIRSKMPLPSKITIMAYIGTYYALGSAWLFTVLDYFLMGFFNGWLDHYYLNSFRVYFAIILVFTVLGNISLAYFRYRISEGELLKGLLKNFMWIPLMTIFLGGISMHISQALFCHFFSIDMEWGSTTKEAEDIAFFEALKNVWWKFKWCFLFCFTMSGVMVACRFALPKDWQIDLLIAIWPMGTVIVNHALLPIVLNPELMTFMF